MDSLNNREIATILWLIILFVLVFSKKDTRLSFLPVINAFTEKLILISFSLFVLYNIMIICFLNYADFWDSNQIKNTIIWFFTTVAVSFFRLPRIEHDPSYFKKAIIDNFKIIVFIEFILSFYAFSLPVEMIFVPFVAFLTLSSAISEKNLLVTKLLDKIWFLLGLIIVIYTLYKLITSFGEFAQKKTLYDFSLPVILSILQLPFIYFLYVYMVYEGVFKYIQFLIKDKKLCRYTKKTAILKYHLNLSKLRQWIDIIKKENIIKKSDIDETHKELSRLLIEKKSPPIIPFEFGWSPYSISTALVNEGLKIDDYEKLFDDHWFGISSYLKIGEGNIPNNIVYSITGNKKAVTCLTLTMNIFETNYARLVHERLIELASILYLNVFSKELEEKYKDAILNNKNVESDIYSKTVKVVTDYWPTNRGYDVTFLIENSE